MDYEPEEVERKVSIANLGPIRYKRHEIDLLDTPGFFDFVGEVESAIRAADACIVVCAVSGLKSELKRLGIMLKNNN